MEQLPSPVARRAPQWIYLLPVAGAPLAHIFVSLAKRAPPPRARMWLAATAAATAAAVGNRMWLMADAGYPGQERDKPEREHEVAPAGPGGGHVVPRGSPPA